MNEQAFTKERDKVLEKFGRGRINADEAVRAIVRAVPENENTQWLLEKAYTELDVLVLKRVEAGTLDPEIAKRELETAGMMLLEEDRAVVLAEAYLEVDVRTPGAPEPAFV